MHFFTSDSILISDSQVNMPTDSFESPLTLAACGGHVDLAILLIERGANIEEVNDEGYTPLMEAAREGHEDMVAVLLQRGKEKTGTRRLIAGTRLLIVLPVRRSNQRPNRRDARDGANVGVLRRFHRSCRLPD